MIDRGQPIKGVVQGLGSGVLDEDLINLPRSVPYVERSLNWVRVAQRFPVRVRLAAPPPDLMRLGASAIVEVKHGRWWSPLYSRFACWRRPPGGGNSRFARR